MDSHVIHLYYASLRRVVGGRSILLGASLGRIVVVLFERHGWDVEEAMFWRDVDLGAISGVVKMRVAATSTENTRLSIPCCDDRYLTD